MRMCNWRTDIENAPRDGQTILVFGQPTDMPGLRFLRPGVHTAYWDMLDERFCVSGATWAGPFIAPTHWKPVEPPVHGSTIGGGGK